MVNRRKPLRLGIMQGRLSESIGGAIQAFPSRTWADEFVLASGLGLNYIEFIYDVDPAGENPLSSEEGLSAIRDVVERTGIHVETICADYYMRSSVLEKSRDGDPGDSKKLVWLVDKAFKIGARRIVLPLLEESSIKQESAQSKFLECCKRIGEQLDYYSVELALETDFEPPSQISFLERINHPLIRVTYDTGNSAALGFDSEEELTTFGNYISHVHIKDCLVGGGTVPLGMGDVDFGAIFNKLHNMGYEGSFTLQAARGGANEIDTVAAYIQFVENLWSTSK